MNITFDLETLGTDSTAPIVQIGAVKFKDNGEIIDSFLRTIDLKSLEKYNFEIDYSTINWWFNQEEQAINSVFGNYLPKVSLKKALMEFNKWIGNTSEYIYWSHATFDPPILVNAFKKTKVKNNIRYISYGDIRTLQILSPNTKKPIRKGVHHNALDDCMYQAEYISKLLISIKKI